MKIAKKMRESGQALVEFALIMPILLMLLCGIIDFGWIYSNQLMVDFSARDGARYGSINAANISLSIMVSDHVKVNALVADKDKLVTTTVQTGPDVSVKVDYEMPLLTPVISTIMGKNTYIVSSTCIMKSE